MSQRQGSQPGAVDILPNNSLQRLAFEVVQFLASSREAVHLYAGS